MIPDTASAVTTAPATQQDIPAVAEQDTLTELLQDREWVAAQFAAIMTASGFGDRVIVGTLPDPPHDRRRRVRDGNPRWRRSTRRTGAAPRVRSPPGR